MRYTGLFALTLAATLLAPVPAPHAQQNSADEPIALQPTNHPRLPGDLSKLWMAPLRQAQGQALSESPAVAQFAEAVKLEVDANFARALPILSQAAVQQGPLGDYAVFYEGLAQLRLGHAADARRTFQDLQAKPPVGYLVEAAALREAEADETLGDQNAALDVYERLAKLKNTSPDDVLMRMGRAARAAGRTDKATEAFSRVVYEFPFSDLAPLAAAELETLPLAPIEPGTNRYKLELGRAERLFGAKRYAQAKPAFDALKHAASGDDRELVNLRLAEIDYFSKRPRQARDAVRPYIEKASRQGEALYFYAVATRELGDDADYLRTVRRIVTDFPEQSWAEEALNNLASHYIVRNDDEEADATFREMYEKYPTGRYAERAAWKIGWYAYKNGRYADTVRVFESAAARFPRSDYRPSWLYWSGRAHGRLNEPALAEARYQLVAADYLNTYYGRLAAKQLTTPAPQRRLIVDQEPADPIPLPPNEPTIRALLALQLYDQAIDELHFAQKAYGDSPAIQATLGWIYNQRGDLRAGINAVRRAYPQYMAAGGEQLPPELLRVLFPVNYWPIIKRYSELHHVDPYMMAALCLQESNFTADIKSPANAYGVMQLLPSTGRQYAKSLHLTKRFSLSMLTTAETNINMGTAHFADLVRQFGGAHYALASYNAGENRIARWIAERPGIDTDEWIDDIPFPETQNYVKRIMGQAEDYRRLYGGSSAAAADAADAQPAVATTNQPPAAKKASATPAASAAKKAPAKKKAAAKKSRKAA
ncbi:MAG TPA: transglycosylase SLT domain-containing protein [Vicinamibacterales bacterium]|nr:transglycosylase SLT domain-containing protein [Vicinamibacterales bacterium]